MNERLLMVLTQVSDHFGGRPLRVVSGYRTTSWVEESKHPLGRACDFVVLGVPNKVLRDYLRSLDNVGVGYYPNSTFVHLDVRERTTYWVDYAGPGEPPRLTPTRVIPKDPTATAALEREPLDAHAEPADDTSRPRAERAVTPERDDLPRARAEREDTLRVRVEREDTPRTREREDTRERAERTTGSEPEPTTIDVTETDD